MDAEKQLEVHLLNLKDQFGIDDLNDILMEITVLAGSFELNKDQVIGALKRDYSMRWKRKYSFPDKGGRPSQIKQILEEIELHIEKGEWHLVEMELEHAKTDLSRTSFWKLKKQLQEKHPTRYFGFKKL